MYSPEFKGPIEGWVVNHMTKNYWKVAATQERADVMQEAYLVFLKVRKHYPSIEAPQHFMALFKRSWSNHFTDLANEDTARRVEVEHARTYYEDGGGTEVEYQGDLDNDGTLAILLREAPTEVTMVLNLFLSAPQELLELALSSWKGGDRRCRAGGSKKICQMLGLPQDQDVMQEVEDYFKRD